MESKLKAVRRGHRGQVTKLFKKLKTEEPETAVMYTSQHTSVLLKTAIAPISYGKQITEASILFDEGAQRSFITQSMTEKLQIRPSGRNTIELSAFGDKEQNIRHLDTATVQLQTDKGEIVNINALIVPDIAVPLLNQTKYLTRNLPYLKDLKLAHPANNADSFEISLLIGADYYWDIVQDHVIRGNGPTAVASKIGYLLSGPVIKNGKKSLTSSVLLNVTSHHAEESEIEKFGNLESLGIRLPQQDDEESFVKTYQQDCIKFENERYSAKLPWKLDHPDLPSNIMIAKTRTECTIRRLSREPHLLRKYSEIVEDQMKRGFIEKVNDKNDNGKSIHYIPHHAVKRDSTTTPIRIVYDCSCKKSPDHASLNDCLMSTPPDLNNFTKILMGFRTKKYAISTDIEKAFLHIGLDEKDRDFTRFFWLSDTDNPSSTLTTYRFKSILFGATSSPFILNATLLKHLDACNTNVSAMMKNDLYVDNILSSLENEDDAAKYFVQARSLMSDAGFNLCSWSSNCSKLTDLAKQHNVCEKETFVKILGLKWDTVKDTITFQKVDLFDIELPNITKREILKQSSRIYDPLGLLSPVSVRAKFLMQTLWEQKYGWDEPLPLEIQTTWKNLAKNLEKTTYTELKRPYFPNLQNQKTQLHVFVDASTTAYGASVYICNHHESSLVIAKNRVAPLKQLTLPQLELMAALIGARLADHVKSVLHIQWLSTSKQLKRFIRNRVTEIRKLTYTQEWRYCLTKDNPADLLTRGLSVSQFEKNTLWFNGPEWITDASKWPSWKPNDTTVLLTSTDIEESSTADNAIDNQQGIHQIVQITRYRTLSKLLRLTSYLLRFIRNCRSPILQRNKAKYVSREELQDATECWILNCQRTLFKDEMLYLKLKDTKPTVLVRQLRLYLNNKDAISCEGRIHNAPVCEISLFVT